MRNFYYVQSYNLMHPAIRSMMDQWKFASVHDSFADLKVTSKHFIGFYEATSHAHEDFDKKLKLIYPNDKEGTVREENVKIITVMNPKFALPDEVAEKIAEKFGEQHAQWDDDCCGTIFFCDVPEGEEDDEFPASWMLKYEIYFYDDDIKLVRKNGEYAFEPTKLPVNSFTSSLH